MNILTFLIPLALLIAGSAAAAFVWSVRSGQLDDLDTPPRRLIADDVCLTPATTPASRGSAAPARGVGSI
jgi:cbb3-type cytochrome oxidase maturation protein